MLTRSALVLLCIFSIPACKSKQAPKAPAAAPAERGSGAEPDAADKGAVPTEGAPEPTTKGDPCDGGE